MEEKIIKFFHWLFGVRRSLTPASVPQPVDLGPIKTLTEWMGVFQIPSANIFNWDMPSNANDGMYKHEFANWYQIAGSHKEFIRRLLK